MVLVYTKDRTPAESTAPKTLCTLQTDPTDHRGSSTQGSVPSTTGSLTPRVQCPIAEVQPPMVVVSLTIHSQRSLGLNRLRLVSPLRVVPSGPRGRTAVGSYACCEPLTTFSRDISSKGFELRSHRLRVMIAEDSSIPYKILATFSKAFTNSFRTSPPESG